jgi:hypothetical protein
MAERLNSSNQGRLALQSSGVQAFDPVGKQLDAKGNTLPQIAELQDAEMIRQVLALSGEDYDEMGFLGGMASSTTAKNIAQSQYEVFNDLLHEQDFADGEFLHQYNAGFYYNPDNRTSGRKTRSQKYGVGPTFRGIALPASALVDLPTSTSNWKRPRTVAAGYDYDEESDLGTITVVFRDGTFYNYYDVPSSVWVQFHASFSKGPMLNKASSKGKQAQDGKLLAYKHGPADMSQLSKRAQEFLYRVARTVQIYSRETAPRTDSRTNKAYQSGKYTTVGAAQNVRVGRKRDLNKAAKNNGYNPNRNAGRNKKP